MCKLKRWLAMRWSHSAYGRTEMTMNGETALEQFLFVFSSNAVVFARMGFLVYTTQSWRCSSTLAPVIVASARIRVDGILAWCAKKEVHME